ncbi:hypothetical protein ACH4S9_20295 [Streptomyces sp. NPDC021225]|uniref:hypothetical protein n=1 Tax=Streptomyces sp. NPDC021225 TaxID=3365121 RepID=UPI0037B4B55D
MNADTGVGLLHHSDGAQALLRLNPLYFLQGRACGAPVGRDARASCGLTAGTWPLINSTTRRVRVFAMSPTCCRAAPHWPNTANYSYPQAGCSYGVAAARFGELEEAVSVAGRALQTSRKSLPSLLMVAGELTDELEQRYPRESLSQEFREQVTHIAAGAQTALGT